MNADLDQIKFFNTAGEIVNSFDCYHLSSDLEDTFHLVMALSGKKLKSLIVKVRPDNSIISREEWTIPVGSKIWYLDACNDVNGEGMPEIFTGREDGSFHAYTFDGHPTWSHDFNGTISEFLVYKDLDHDKYVLLIPALDNTLRLVDAIEGSLIWGDTFGSGVNCADQKQVNNRHYIVAGGNDHTLRCYKRKPRANKIIDYELAWFTKFSSYVRDVAISKAGIVVAVSDDGFLKAFNATSYQVPISIDDSGELLGNPGIVACHVLHDGKLCWNTEPQDGVNVNSIRIYKLNNSFNALISTTGGKVLVLDVLTGGVLREYEFDTQVNDAIMITPDVVDVPLIVASIERKSDGIAFIQYKGPSTKKP
ncbi:MAG: hypothetical protein ACTSRA_14525 [Promethearchaeota archaeon]